MLTTLLPLPYKTRYCLQFLVLSLPRIHHRGKALPPNAYTNQHHLPQDNPYTTIHTGQQTALRPIKNPPTPNRKRKVRRSPNFLGFHNC